MTLTFSIINKELSITAKTLLIMLSFVWVAIRFLCSAVLACIVYGPAQASEAVLGR